MLTIPKAKLNAASVLVKENSNPFNMDKNKIKNLAPAARAKLNAFLVNFNTFVIYFDPVLDLSKFPYIIKGIKELKGSVAPFMKKGLTHYITPNNSMSTQNKNSDKVLAAQKLGLVIWNISKLEKLIAICLELKNEPKPLKEILRDEQIFGPSTSRDRGKRGCKVQFKGNFLLIEENSGKYKPVAVKEFEKESWPCLQFANSIGKCAFIKESKKVVSEDEKSDGNDTEKYDTFKYYKQKISEMLQDKLVNVPEIQGDIKFLNLNSAPLKDMQEYEEYAKAKLGLYEKLKQNPTTVFQAASGLISGAQALKRDMTKDPRVAYLGTRVVSLVKESKVKNDVPERCVPGKSFYNRPGYCENCNANYNRFYEHVRSRQHKYWARNVANFKDLDILFSEMQRNQLKKNPAPSDTSSFYSNIDIEALNADIYDSSEEYPFNADASKNDKKSPISDNNEVVGNIKDRDSSSEEMCILESYARNKAEKMEDAIRTQGNQTEPLEAKFSHHSLHLDYQYGDTSGGSTKEKSNPEDWLPVKMTRHRTKQEHLIMNPTEDSKVNDVSLGSKRSTTNVRGLGSSKKKRKTKQVKTPTIEIPYSLRNIQREITKSHR